MAASGGDDPAVDLPVLLDAAAEASRIAMAYFHPSAPNEVWRKPGDSPVSEADYAVDKYLRETLLAARPDYGWLSEETEDNADRLSRDTLFVVDPIDGTRGFIEGRREWCISLAIVSAGKPVAGVLACPAMDRTYYAARGGGGFLNGSALPPLAGDRLSTVTASRRLNMLIERRYGGQLTVLPFVPSLAYRLAMVAGGEVDAAFARPGAHDWDLAAAEIILQEVGGRLTGLDGRPWRYNRKRPVSGALLASGANAHEKLMHLAKTGGFLH